MAKKDYFVITYKILAYLYGCFQAGEGPDTDFFGAEALEINKGYWVNVMESLYNEGYITGVEFITSGGVQGAKLMNLKITQKGIEYLQENSTMAKAKDFLKVAKEIIPGM